VAEQTDHKVYWLRFKLEDMNDDGLVGSYSPEVVADGADVSELPRLLRNNNVTDQYSSFLERCQSGEGGVCIHLHDTTLRKAVSPELLLRSLGRRFTVTLLRADFRVEVSGKEIKPEDAFPKFFNFGFGDHQNTISEEILCGGILRKIRYWVKFVSLSGEDWSIENAGVGVYAHGKIAQDRPFFFDVKGKEIFSRYLYAVIEADWLDELKDDVVSTDRRSINWDSEYTQDLHAWGAKKLPDWVDAFHKWRVEQPTKEIMDLIRKESPETTLSSKEVEALAGLLSEVLPSLGNDEEAKSAAIVSAKAAWTHEPMRRIAKRLWNNVFASNGMDAAHYAVLIEDLRGSLVPEAMGLAVTVAQRVAAITAMRRMIEAEKTETHLQRLIEEFPWLLGPQWEKLCANTTIRKLVTSKFKPNQENGTWDISVEDGEKRPDFVFLSDVGVEREIVVFELKGPECGKTLLVNEYRQLSRYMEIIQDVHTNIPVTGVLVGHEKGGFNENNTAIETRRWSEVLLSARQLHISYLAALLKASKPDLTDARIQMIADFGGDETMELLDRIVKLAELHLPSAVTEVLTSGM